MAPLKERREDRPVSTLLVSDVTAGYDDTTVLQDITLEAGVGSVTAILGRNGAGKTTLLNVMLGWIRPTAGSVSVGGAPVLGLSPRERGRSIGLVPQAEHMAFEYSILEYVLLGRAPHVGPTSGPGSEDVELCRSAIARVGLAGMEAKGVLETSAGERQLVLLARAIAQGPSVLLMDEPSAHLDLRNRRALVDLIREDARQGRTVVLSAHEPDFAAEVADRIVLLADGALFADGTPDEALTSERLSAAYGAEIRAETVSGRPVFLW